MAAIPHIHSIDASAGHERPRLSLRIFPDEVLRAACDPVDNFDSTLRDVADEMLSLMQHHRGIGLAAPQVGQRQRLIVSLIEDHPLMLANLEVKDAAEPRDFVEGCLSLPGARANRCRWTSNPATKSSPER